MPTLANAGVPMLVVVGPVFLVAFLPIVFVEAGLYRWRLGIEWRRAALGSLGANTLSTIFGVPLAWLALVVVQMVTGGGSFHGIGIHAVTWQAPWLVSHEEHLPWMIPVAGIVLCGPFLLASVLIEYRFLRAIWVEQERATVGRACWMANGLTYCCLAAFWGLLLVL